MSDQSEIDLALGVLDHQLVDRDGRRCGKVDDLELAGVESGNARVTAILVGPAAWRGRGRLGRLLAAAARSREPARVAWREVARVDSAVHLRSSAEELGLGAGDRRAERWLQRVPAS